MSIRKLLFFITTLLLITAAGHTANSAFSKTFEIDKVIPQASKVSISIKIFYLGEPVKGVKASIIEDGNTLTSSSTNKRGKTKLSVHDYDLSPVTLHIHKEGYQTQMLIGLIMKKGSNYEFSLTKGDGTITTEVDNDIQKINKKGRDKVEKYEEKATDYREDAKAYAEDEKEYRKETREEKNKRKEIESKTRQIIKETVKLAEESLAVEKKIKKKEKEIKARKKAAKKRMKIIKNIGKKANKNE